MTIDDYILKKDVLKFEEDLNDLTNRIGDFIQDAKNDVEYEASAEEIAAAGDDEPELDEEGNALDNQEQKDMKAAGKSDKSDKKDKKEEDVKENFESPGVSIKIIDSSISEV